MAIQFLPMPAIAYPQNAMINFAPMNQALQFHANNQLERGRFGLQQNADLREQEMHPLRMDQTRAQTGLANAHGDYYTGQNRRADAMHPFEVEHRRAQTGLTRAQTGMSAAHANLYNSQATAAGEALALRRRQLDALELQRDRGFTLQMLQSLSAAQTPEQFAVVARALAPRLRRVPTFNERDTLLATLGDALEEYDVVPGPDGQVQRVPRGFTADVSAAMRGLDAQTPNVAAASMGAGGVGGLRTMIPPAGQASAQPQTGAAGMTDADIFRRFPVLAPQGTLSLGAPQPAHAAPPPPTLGPAPVTRPPQGLAPAGPPQPANAIAPRPGMVPVVAGGSGNAMVQPVMAPGGMLPPVVGGSQPVQGAPVPAQGPVPRNATAMRQGAVAEIEAQYGAPSTWGQSGAQPPPFSVIQRYWQIVHGGRPPSGMQFAADGTLQPIPGAPQRGGGRGGGSNAAANAATIMGETVPQIENAAEYMLNSNSALNVLAQVPGAQMLGITGFNNARSTLEFGTSTIMHALSGATTTQREFERYVQAFLPNASDLDNVRRYKINSLMMVVRAVQARASGGAISDETMAPIRREMLRRQRELLGLSSQAGGAATGPPGGTGGWGGAGSMSTQDIINNLGRR